MLIAASEEVGNADPMAICVAASAAIAVERVGMPEGRIILAQAAAYFLKGILCGKIHGSVSCVLKPHSGG